MYVFLVKDNSIIQGYWDKYLQLIRNKYLNLVKRGYLKLNEEIIKDENINFRRYGDINSIVNFLYEVLDYGFDKYFYTKERFSKYKNYLEKQIEFFINKENDKLIFKQGKRIADTNIYLSDKDLNPYNIMDTHPDHSGVGVGRGEAEKQYWYEIYNKTFKLLKQIDDGVWYELNVMINKIVPLWTAYNRHNSASYKECIGHLYLGLTLGVDDPEIFNIEAVIHESSHNKINLISHFDKLVLNGGELEYYSPYRPDPRHIWGIFLGLHAFAPTIYYLVLGYKKGVLNNLTLNKVYLYHLKNKFALRVLKKYGKFTSLGLAVLDEIKEVLEDTDRLIKDIGFIYKVNLEEVKNIFKQHLMQVRESFPLLKF